MRHPFALASSLEVGNIGRMNDAIDRLLNEINCLDSQSVLLKLRAVEEQEAALSELYRILRARERQADAEKRKVARSA